MVTKPIDGRVRGGWKAVARTGVDAALLLLFSLHMWQAAGDPCRSLSQKMVLWTSSGALGVAGLWYAVVAVWMAVAQRGLDRTRKEGGTGDEGSE